MEIIMDLDKVKLEMEILKQDIKTTVDELSKHKNQIRELKQSYNIVGLFVTGVVTIIVILVLIQVVKEVL